MDVTNSSSKLDKYWVDSPNQCHYDRNLNFAAIGSEDDEAYSSFSKKPKSARDPQSHRIIEKRRRDRMNNCLADLSRLLPVAYMKKGRGRIEKTEIIEMTIKHMKHLQVHACKEMETCEIAVQMEQLHSNTKSDQYRSGFLECISETVKFIGHHQTDHHHAAFYTGDEFCNRLVAHLHNHYDKMARELKSLGDGTGSETGDYPAGPASLATRTGQANGAGPPGNEEEEVASTVSASNSCAPPQAVDQYKSPTEAEDNEKIKDDRLKEMFNYFNASSSSEHHRPQQQHSNGPRAARSSSGSGGDSDESRSNRATRNSDTPSPNHPTTDGSSPTDMDNSSHSGGSNHSSSRSGNSSQLRQMLLASNGESSSTSRTKSCSSSSSGRSNTTQMSSEDSSNMYKFKTNIHQRFTADLEHVFPQSSCLMTPSSTSSLPEQQVQSNHHPQQSFEPGHGLKRKLSDCERHNNLDYGWNPDVLPPPPVISSRSPRLRSEETEEMPLPSEVALQHHQQQYQQHANGALENVPIFALHPKGAFYVPMSVELPLIQGLFDLVTTSENAQPLLHPVTISVNFCHPLRVLTATLVANSSTSSIQHSSVIQPPVRLPRPELVLPGLIPAPPSVPQRHHQQYELDPSGSLTGSSSGSGSSNGRSSYSPMIIDESRLRGREHVRSIGRHHEELKSIRAPQREEGGYANGVDSRVRDYAVIRSSSREHGTRSPAVITTATHSSRWSHLMAKRTHTP